MVLFHLATDFNLHNTQSIKSAVGCVVHLNSTPNILDEYDPPFQWILINEFMIGWIEQFIYSIFRIIDSPNGWDVSNRTRVNFFFSAPKSVIIMNLVQTKVHVFAWSLTIRRLPCLPTTAITTHIIYVIKVLSMPAAIFHQRKKKKIKYQKSHIPNAESCAFVSKFSVFFHIEKMSVWRTYS